jgi:hypothetical protein
MIYVIENVENGHLKIGKAYNTKKRLAFLQTANSCDLRLLKEFDGGHSLERKIHRDLKKYKIRGEWFMPDDAVWKYLDSLCNYEYELFFGRPCLVLWRDLDCDDCETDCCPFCGHCHEHGVGDGHRATHCYGDSQNIKEFITATDGTVLHRWGGYIIKSRKPAVAESGAAA